jgi:hypothetical protein
VTSTRKTEDIVPGVPNQPDLVTVVPFYTKPEETDLEKTKVVIQAEVDGRRGVFIFDLGAEPVMLNRSYLQPNAADGVDTVTDANRAPDNTPKTDYWNNENFFQFDRAHVSIRMGTLISHFDDPLLTTALHESNPHRYNVLLGHLWGNFTWVFAPRLGNIGPAAIEPFEAIVDYTNKRVVLIRLDSVGHRMINVPAYTPRWTGPLRHVDLGFSGLYSLGIAVGPENKLDTLNVSNNIYLREIDTGAPESDDETLGYSFLSQFGVFGINQRTHQFILYH